MEIRAFEGPFGAEVLGLDLAAPLTARELSIGVAGNAGGRTTHVAPHPVDCADQGQTSGPVNMHKALLIDPQKCTSCMQCELACSFEHTGAFNPARSRIKIFEFEHGARSIPYTCTQCEEAWCLHACPVEAITVNPATGAKEVDPNICVGCKVCTIACPFGTINYSADTGKVVKCDLCGGDPQCAEACPTGAITYVDASWTGLGRMQASAVAAHGQQGA